MRKYEDLSRIHENTLPPRAHYIPYDSLEKALNGDKFTSEYYTLLNGEWDFRYFSRDIDCPDSIAEWDKVNVPSCWQMTGYEKPCYVDILYPIPIDPPYVPNDNPVGVYRKTVTADEKMASMQNYLIFEGVAPCVELFVNGEYIGFSTVSHCTSEFKINLNVGENEIIAKVYKWCMGTYLEDQDSFRNNGIFRDVYILSRPEGHIFDVSLGYDDKEVWCDTPFTLYDKEGNIVDSDAPKILWNAEKPYLYTAVIAQAGEYIPFKIGFRTQSIMANGEILINGVSVKLKGVNHHDTNPDNGYCMTREDVILDLVKMKELNINCIRTAHYPPQPEFIELCDEMGFYVIDEADNETHGFSSRAAVCKLYDQDERWPGRNPAWCEAHIDRAARLFERDKNHTSIIMWSLGNEAACGENFFAMNDYIRGRDNVMGFHRFIHYQGSTHLYEESERNKKPDPDFVDIVSRMYWPVDVMDWYVKNTGDTRPFFQCEYAHCMGNSPGDLVDYWNAFYKNPQYIGGCIWEWADHVAPLGDGKYGYGGDFGEAIHNKNYCCDGLVFHDRSFKAGSYEAKYAYQPMATEWNDGVLTVTNRYDFTDLCETDTRYEYTIDGKTVSHGTLDLAAAPHDTVCVNVDLPDLDSTLGAYLDIYMDKDGRNVAHTQHEISSKVILPMGEKLPVITTDKECATIKGEGFEHKFNLHYGRLEKVGNLIESPMKLTLWRAPTDNDDYKIRSRWEKEKYQFPCNMVYDCRVEQNTITVIAALSTISKCKLIEYTAKYTFHGNGQIDVDFKGKLDSARTYLPRLGFEFKTQATDFTYFGYGPYESYIDLHHGSKMGMYESTAEREYVNYVMPQEHGNHYNTKMLTMGGYKFISESGFEFKVSEYSAEELTKKTHYFELKKDKYTNVRIDWKVSGIGSESCGPELDGKYQVKDENIDFKFSIVKI